MLISIAESLGPCACLLNPAVRGLSLQWWPIISPIVMCGLDFKLSILEVVLHLVFTFGLFKLDKLFK